MKYRFLGKTKFKVSEIGYGSWSLGADWGNVSDEQAKAALASLENAGINFIDTADIYGDGRSERLIGEYTASCRRRVIVATKIGRRLSPHVAEGYTKSNIAAFVDRCRKNLRTDRLDLVQLHTPPTQVFYRPEIFSFLDELVKKGWIKYYGVSVEKVEEGLKAIEHSNVSSVQIIFNMFRQRPMELFFREAKRRNVGVIVRVPLASGLLTGKFHIISRFPKNDHRSFNRRGQYFDIGETFAGVDFGAGLKAVRDLRAVTPKEFTMAQFALRWILMQDAVSTVIAGGKSPNQIMENSRASDMPTLDKTTMDGVRAIYIRRIKPYVHDRW